MQYRQSVTIGIPTLNGPDRLRRCLKSIERCTNWSNFDRAKLLLCDDCSTPENLEANKGVLHEAELLRRVAGAEMLMSQTRDGISKSWNKLARHQPSDVIVLLNDDIEVVDRWLDVLVYSVTENLCAGMVGLNSYGGVMKSQIEALHPDALDHVRELQLDYREAKLQSGGGSLLSSQGYAFAMRREVYDQAGGFDERYFCFYEELDMGVTLKRLGYQHFTASYPIIYHMGGATNSETRNLDAQQHMRESGEKFRAKWGKSIGELRSEFSHRIASDQLREWNSQIANWQ